MGNKKYLLDDPDIAATRIHNQRVRFIEEEIKDLFGIKLFTCPDCSCILSSYDGRMPNNVYCPVCQIDIEEHDCPDLFY